MKQPDVTDEALMAAVVGGDRRAMETLLRRYGGPLLTFIRRMVGDHHRAEELFQDVFLRVWTKRRQFRTGQPFRPWLYTIARNCCRADYRRMRKRQAAALQGEAAASAAPGPSPADALLMSESAGLVAAAVAQLPERQREVVVLRVWIGLSYAEIAQAVCRTEATVRSHMHHALAGLRKLLDAKLS